MPESGTYGSVRGALSNGRPYRDRLPKLFSAGRADVRLDSVWAGLRFLA